MLPGYSSICTAINETQQYHINEKLEEPIISTQFRGRMIRLNPSPSPKIVHNSEMNVDTLQLVYQPNFHLSPIFAAPYTGYKYYLMSQLLQVNFVIVLFVIVLVVVMIFVVILSVFSRPTRPLLH